MRFSVERTRLGHVILGVILPLWHGPSLVQADWQVVDDRLHHLRSGERREWTEFPQQAEAAKLAVTFSAEENATEYTLRWRQQDVKQMWMVSLNGRPLGRRPLDRLIRDENDMVVYRAIPAGRLVSGENTLTITPSGSNSDDIRIGELAIHPQPMVAALSAASVEVEVLDKESRQPLPARITVLDANGSLHAVGAESNDSLAVRTGVIYTGNGRARFGLPAGEYTIYAGRGFEYGIDSAQITVRSGETIRRQLTIRREVPTPGYVSCDTHVHTLTHSGHGDATIEERMLTLAGEGIELPIATDHNKHIDYESLARRMGVRQYFTPVIGNEVTTKVGHFNIFPVQAGAPVPNFRLTEWQAIFESIKATPGVRVIILNHARDLHSGVRPFGPKWHNAVVGENLQGWKLQANAMELVNSGAQQTDIMRLYHDWLGLLNRGLSVTPVGCSDSHDVSRHFVGQGRTYIRCDDTDPGRIDVNQAVESFVAGRVMVSAGLLAEITVDETYGPGDLVPVDESQAVTVSVRVLGPSWTTAERVELYANGQKIREATISDDGQPGVKWRGQWKLTDLRHDVHLVAVARGPGVRELYWPIAKPYQPTSPNWHPQIIGSTGAVWLDCDGDGYRTPAREYAGRLTEQFEKRLPELIKALADYDEAVAAHVAGFLDKRGLSPFDARLRSELPAAAPQTRRGFQQFAEAWRANQQARLQE